MGFRTVVIKNRCKLDLQLNYLVARSEEETRIFIPEISILIIESTAVALTSALLSELTKNNVKIIFCDEKHNPESEIIPYHYAYDSPGQLFKQLKWKDYMTTLVWTKIVRQKIIMQAMVLKKHGLKKQAIMLLNYARNIEFGDSTNREGLAAKVYFFALHGKDFNRNNENLLNSCLNYGYSILLSMFNREIVACGYLTQLGIGHHGVQNNFNLSCDLMEPFRPYIDEIILNSNLDEKNFKKTILNEMANLLIKIGGRFQHLSEAISIYCHSVFKAIENETWELIKFNEFKGL